MNLYKIRMNDNFETALFPTVELTVVAKTMESAKEYGDTVRSLLYPDLDDDIDVNVVLVEENLP